MSEVTASIPDEALPALKRTEEEIGQELRLAAAVKLYELGRCSQPVLPHNLPTPYERVYIPEAMAQEIAEGRAWMTSWRGVMRRYLR
ncbi:MAG TPA: UPF0175 family protein [Chthonomonadales bacterium]|nr:UPF0175 family protein [Chthonomonadales bacterium]